MRGGVTDAVIGIVCGAVQDERKVVRFSYVGARETCLALSQQTFAFKKERSKSQGHKKGCSRAADRNGPECTPVDKIFRLHNSNGRVNRNRRLSLDSTILGTIGNRFLCRSEKIDILIEHGRSSSEA
jgi:hypothetical protein